MKLKDKLEGVGKDLTAIEGEMAKAVVGQREVIRCLLTALMANGHILVEGLPGLGKTLIVKTLRDVLHLNYSRIQFTPDLMPADITGTNIIDAGEGGGKAFRFEPGPIFTNLLLADEINRASPKTQSALLQAMQEKEVTAFGKHYAIEEPFYTIATQNPIEMEGTYSLPEAQLDRFLFKINIVHPGQEDLMEIADKTIGRQNNPPLKICDRQRILEMRDLIQDIPVAVPIMRRTARLVLATHPGNAEAPEITRRYVRYGVSPRGMQALVASARVTAAIDGRFHVSWEDILQNLLPAFRHRLILNFEGELQKVGRDEVLLELSRSVNENKG